jgi:hypothetical protein
VTGSGLGAILGIRVKERREMEREEALLLNLRRSQSEDDFLKFLPRLWRAFVACEFLV